MAEAVADEVFDHEVEGAIKCRALGCPNWFRRAGNRHQYCKAPTCTYRRGAPSPLKIDLPNKGAAAELLLRLQDEEDGEVGPELLVHRRKAVGDALRAGDMASFAGALVDEAAVCIWIADRAKDGDLPKRPAPPETPTRTPTSAVGMVQAVLLSHRRSIDLADTRHESIWNWLKAKEELASAERGVAATQGGPKEAIAQKNCEGKRVLYDEAQRTMETIEGAWGERKRALGDLATAGGAARVSG